MQNLSPESLFDLSNYRHASIFNDCAYVWDALSKIAPYLETAGLGKIEGEVSKDAHLVNPELISIGKGTVVEPGAYISGPCIIGEECQVRSGAYIRGNLITGNNCVLGHDSEFKNVIMLDGAKAAHFAYVGDSILGNAVNLGAGTVLANLRLDRKQISIKLNGEKIDTGRKKFGAALGDHSQTGCNSVLNPGTIFAKGAMSLPCVNVSGFIQ
ncbi:MAG: UDP-N-acetylglucosamine diphosphorylase [Waddliaceae bacterium]